MSRTASAGAIVGIYVDLVAPVATGDVIETTSGRRYRAVEVRVQQRGHHVGRQHLRCLVMSTDDPVDATVTVHQISWYRRRSRGRK